jgi:hypothetical protein
LLVILCDTTVNLAQCLVLDDDDDYGGGGGDELVRRLRWDEIIKENKA